MYVYADADWAEYPTDRISTIGYLVYFGSTPISCSSKKQRDVSRSSTEAEYRFVASALVEINWVSTELALGCVCGEVAGLVSDGGEDNCGGGKLEVDGGGGVVET